MFLSLCLITESRRPRLRRVKNDKLPNPGYSAVVINPEGAYDRSHRYKLDYEEEVDVYEVQGDMYVIPINHVQTSQFSAYNFILKLDNEGEERPELPKRPVYLNNTKLNSNIRKWGHQFLCYCYIAGLHNPDEINSLYSQAISKNWMYTSGTIRDHAAFAEFAKAQYLKQVFDHYRAAKNELRIAHCRTKESLWIYYVVADRKGNILFDPAGETPIEAVRDEIILGY